MRCKALRVRCEGVYPKRYKKRTTCSPPPFPIYCVQVCQHDLCAFRFSVVSAGMCTFLISSLIQIFSDRRYSSLVSKMYPELHTLQYCIYGLMRSQAVTMQISTHMLGGHENIDSSLFNTTNTFIYTFKVCFLFINGCFEA